MRLDDRGAFSSSSLASRGKVTPVNTASEFFDRVATPAREFFGFKDLAAATGLIAATSTTEVHRLNKI
jgi:hypothetical protein